MTASVRAERRHIARFLSLMGEEVVGEVRYPDPPDAVVQLRRGEVAIEHTRIRLASRDGFIPSAYEDRTNRIVAQTRKLLDPLLQKRLSVQFDFDDRVILRRDEGRQLAQTLAELIRANMPLAGSTVRLDAWWFGARDESPPRGIEALWITNDVTDDSLWCASGGGPVPPLTVDRVQHEISGKDEKVDSYRECGREAWLLLVIGDSLMASLWDLGAFSEEHDFSSEFDRVFLYEHFKAQVIELQVSERDA